MMTCDPSILTEFHISTYIHIYTIHYIDMLTTQHDIYEL